MDRKKKKKKIQKWFICMLVVVLGIGNLTGCKTTSAIKSEHKYSVVCTIFPEYDWVREVIGKDNDDFEVTFLLDEATDLHSYQPTAQDIATISACDLFIYVGGESDEWVDGALKEALNKDMKVINLLDVLGEDVREEETVEGMEQEEEEDGEEETEYDEHVWLSLKNAQTLVMVLTSAICEIDPENQSVYQEHCKEYIAKLKTLDGRYEEIVKKESKHTLVFGDRFPFRYLVEDYGLDYYAAFAGCSAETEASFETIIFLAGKIDELGLSNVMVIENSDQKIAQTITQNTKEKNQEILVMDSMQATTAQSVSGGETYLAVMEKNLQVLEKALQ